MKRLIEKRVLRKEVDTTYEQLLLAVALSGRTDRNAFYELLFTTIMLDLGIITI